MSIDEVKRVMLEFINEKYKAVLEYNHNMDLDNFKKSIKNELDNAVEEQITLFVNRIYTFDTVKTMKEVDLSIGDKVSTRGYYLIDDGGAANYEIMTYDSWYNLLPDDIKLLSSGIDGLGNPKLYKTTVDEYGNHTLSNGLVAKIITDKKTSPEQWGAKGDGITNDVWPFIHLFAQTKTGEINFKSDAVYSLGLTDGKDNPYKAFMVGNFLGNQYFYKPILANISDLNLYGNNCTITIPDNSWGDSGMGILNFGGNIINLIINNFNFDGNCYTMLDGNKTSNHTLVYAPGSLYSSQLGSFKTLQPRYDESLEYKKDNMPFKAVEINNWSIKNCKFQNAGTMINTQDSGGDFILIINPTALNDLSIENNEFINWGRWVFSIDLGGSGERLYNIRFNNNTCIQEDESNKVPYKRQRGLGWIDFESKKSFTNLEIKNNYVEGANGFAINGNSRVSEKVIIYGNNIIRPERNYRSIYPYAFEFYSVQLKDSLFSNNKITSNCGNIKLGYRLHNIKVNNNKIDVKFRVLGMFGDIIFDNNSSTLNSFVQVEGINWPEYIDDNGSKECNFIFTNNNSGLIGKFFDPSDINKYSYIKLRIENNTMNTFNIAAFGIEDFKFNPTQMDGNSAFSARGAVFTNNTFSLNNNPICGGGIYKVGDIITKNLQNTGVSRVDYYYDGTKLGIMDFDSYKYNFNNYYLITKNNIVKCIKEGYLPMGGQFGYADGDMKFVSGNKISSGSYIYTNTDLYIAVNDGTLGTTLDHKEGTALCGDVNMLYLCQLAQLTVSNIA